MTHARRLSSRDLAYVAVFAALIAVLSLAPAVPVGIGVPLTLQTLGVALAGVILGPWRAGAAVVLYVVVGLAGLPIFAGGVAGVAVLVQPAVGYLVAFPFAAVLSGALARVVVRRTSRWRAVWLGLAALAGSILVIHPLGIVGVAWTMHLPLARAWLVDLVYWPGDIVKAALAGAVAAPVHRAFPALLGRD